MRRIHAFVRQFRYKLLMILLNTVFNDLHTRGIGSFHARVILYHEIDEMISARALKQQGRKFKILWRTSTKTSD